MSSRAVKPKRDNVQGSTWQSLAERVPSITRDEGPLFARYVAVVSLMLITLGGAALVFHAKQARYLISSGLGFFMLIIGVSGLVYHAFNEKDFQFRRLYGGLGALLLVVGVFLRLVPITDAKRIGDGFLPYGALSILVSLAFLVCFVKNETEVVIRGYALNLLGFMGLANALAGIIGGGLLSANKTEVFLTETGVIHLVIGLIFGVAFINLQGGGTARGFLAGRVVGMLGGAMILIALARSLWPWVVSIFHWNLQPAPYFLPSGLFLMYIGFEYLVIYLGVCSDNKLVVLTRRELGAFFYSPIAYIVLIAMACAGFLAFVQLVDLIARLSSPQQMMQGGGGGLPEPIFGFFIFALVPVIAVIFLVPIITMRMVSEEKRTGTLEVLLTAPVNEWHVVLAKFLAGLRVFMLCWYLWGSFFIALRMEGDQAFDYRPIITFLIALVCVGSGFIAMGVFFSSVTQHQILAAVLTFFVMLALTMVSLLTDFIGEKPWLNTLITNVSYLDIWRSSSRSVITPRLLFLNLSVAIFWLFLSIKVLESRKWS